MTTIDEESGGSEIESTPARAFAANELVACPKCSRPNAPTRAKCLYCGAPLGTAVVGLPPGYSIAIQASSSTVPADTDTAENLFHVVARLSDEDRAVAEDPSVARFLKLTLPDLSNLLKGKITPLAIATSATQAQAISNELRKTGITTTSISDEDLKLRTRPKEIATFAIDERSLTAFVDRTRARIVTSWEDIALIVIGRLHFTTTEVEQSRRGKQLLDERQLTSDEAVFDLYQLGDPCGWRIRAGKFDFSCLGTEKQPTAFENFRALIDSLRRKAGSALFDEDYARMRAALNKVWPPQAAGSSSDRRRTALRETCTTSTIIDNELQFTRYSRLLSLFQLSESKDDAG